jgi:rhodanese-related sulfurtransferase
MAAGCGIAGERSAPSETAASRPTVSPLEQAAAKAVARFQTPPIGVDAARAWLASEHPPLAVDVRRAEECAVSRLPGAILWRADAGDPLPEPLERAGREGRPVLFYCSIGYRSGAAGDLFRERFPNADARNLEGGLFLWAERGGPLEGGERVHPYDDKWGRLLRPDLRSPLDADAPSDKR